MGLLAPLCHSVITFPRLSISTGMVLSGLCGSRSITYAFPFTNRLAKVYWQGSAAFPDASTYPMVLSEQWTSASPSENGSGSLEKLNGITTLPLVLIAPHLSAAPAGWDATQASPSLNACA